MRIYRSLQEYEELAAEPPNKDIVTISQKTVTEQLTDQQVIRNILTHYVYYILLGAFILIFIGIYCVCKDNKKGKKGKKKRVVPRQRRPRKIKTKSDREDIDIEFQNIFSDKFGQRGMDMSMSVS
ncbi:uncharacterized protein LOC134811818 [Bolinopsis microptera]|uniref:uncharacterized protein LOC134811818 n=1 Tax=Bolinopsis microptera TaxID=2820187 RepID=UPI00307990E6